MTDEFGSDASFIFPPDLLVARITNITEMIALLPDLNDDQYELQLRAIQIMFDSCEPIKPKREFDGNIHSLN